MSSKLHQLVLYLFIQLWRPLANYAVKTGVVGKLCDPHLSAFEVRIGFHDEALYKSTFTFTIIIIHWPTRLHIARLRRLEWPNF